MLCQPRLSPQLEVTAKRQGLSPHEDLRPQSLCCLLHVSGLTGSCLRLQYICWGNQTAFYLSPCPERFLGSWEIFRSLLA